MDSTLCIVGLGAFTPLASDAVCTVAAVRAKYAATVFHPYMVDTQGEPYHVTMAECKDGLPCSQRIQELLVTAMPQALAVLAERDFFGVSVDVMLALPYPRPGLDNDLADRLAEPVRALSNEHYRLNLNTATKGRVGGLIAVASAATRLSNGSAEFCLIAGVDSYIDPDTLLWLDLSGQLYTQNQPWGFIPGEAAACCLVCTPETARRYGLPVYAELLGAAVATEPDSNTPDAVCTGRGLSEAVSQALGVLPETVKIDQLLCDLNGQTYGSDELGFTLARLGNRFKSVNNIVTPADCWGDVGAATGPLLLMLACAFRKDYHEGPLRLVYAGAGPIPDDANYPGERCAIVVNTAITGQEKGFLLWQ